MAESRILGLDMGTNSIGWALIEESSNSKNKTVTGEIVALGSRIFSPPIVGENEIPKNQSRRESRGRRRILARRAMRKKHLVNVLMRSGLLPGSRDEQEKLFKADDPYELRAKGLDESLTLHQFGIVLFHLNQRRGFLSNRKTNKKEEDGKVKPLILQLEKDMEDTGARTLGEFLS
ncbi:MAG: type II CRISPR RNA-guided endonuclease Cas9, partial [Nitrospinota bacterium]